ncbi:hypothetical protein GCM10010156_23260 [Planobispora rosea]|uniref:Uncharacterized protein n=1 Tax=Planobispora rosea TaxID=35762 RepID=A0A8J3S1H3_PLARO|nr:hypothetical protein [Planobispora rosea]GGS63582.1 hypothetical protein GCM10010156_23260 [Planobispora rosea]GIH84490.1 hypothetical protein Pro02_28980 [Planobispora rosea]
MHSQHDVQALSIDDNTVYEAVAALATDGHAAHTADVVHMTGLPEETVRRSLAFLTENGWLKARGGVYALGPHDWEVDYR